MTGLNNRNWKRVAGLTALAVLILPLLAACGGDLGATVKRGAFTSKVFGVSVSPRVTNNPNPPKGGGRYLVGKPYTVRGVVYTPEANPASYVATGVASWYGSDFHGRRTANGEIFSANAYTGAHPTLPLPCYVRVTNMSNGKSMLVRLNDRGPYMAGRIIDLSYKAANSLGLIGSGTGEVQVRYVAPAPLNGDDTRMLLASLDRLTPLEQQMQQLQGDTRLAFAEPAPQPAQRGQVELASMRPKYDQPQAGTLGTYSSDDLAKDFLSIFSYAEAQKEDQRILNAHDAVNAMATRSGALNEWVEAVDEDARAIKLQIGIFSDPDGAIAVAEQFAMLGAVNEEQVEVKGRQATRLTMTHLKPGVARADVLAMARTLGLGELVLY